MKFPWLGIFLKNQLTSFLKKNCFEIIKYEAFMGNKPLENTDWAGIAFVRAV